MEKKCPDYYFTTAIPYVNAKPHLGFALEVVETDALARYYRQTGSAVRFLSGTDDNSLKNVQAAEKAGLPIQEFVATNAQFFNNLRDSLNLSYDDFIRTSSDPRHTPGVHKLWQACLANGDIYRKSYKGLYCVGCEQFYNETELTTDRLCPEHQTPPDIVEEENYFFRLSRYQTALLALIETDTLKILPRSRKNEIVSFIKQGLEDFSISRSQARARGWGIPVPGDPSQVIYVWFDALVNYITALGYGSDEALFQRFWLENPNRTHVIGKGIIRFHAVYWVAMLLSAGLPAPSRILVHGYITLNGQKISKSLGNIIDPVVLAEQYGADPLRQYLLHVARSTDDSDFTEERFIQAYNNELADQLGNLLQRVLGMLQRYFGGVVPAPGSATPLDAVLQAQAAELPEKVAAAIARFALHEATAALWDFAGAANKYVEDTKPWELAKKSKAGDSAAPTQLATALYNLLESLRLIALHLAPFLPTTAAAINQQLGLPANSATTWGALTAWGGYPTGQTLPAGQVLFPKLQTSADCKSV